MYVDAAYCYRRSSDCSVLLPALRHMCEEYQRRSLNAMTIIIYEDCFGKIYTTVTDRSKLNFNGLGNSVNMQHTQFVEHPFKLSNI